MKDVLTRFRKLNLKKAGILLIAGFVFTAGLTACGDIRRADGECVFNC